MSKWKIVVPEATTNLVTNPSFETGALLATPSGWTTDGTNTLDNDDARSKFGVRSCLCTVNNAFNIAEFNITLTAAAHAFSMWVYLSTNWNGGLIRLQTQDFTSVTIDTATTTTTTTGEWVKLEILFTPDAGDLTGDILVETATLPTAGRTIYIDAAQCELKAYTTTYIDGDQAEGEWTGAEHASTSTREALSRAGGRVRDLEDTYSLAVERMVGTGAAAMENVLTNRVFTPGANFEGRIVLPRVFSLVSTVRGSSLANYHALRQAFFNDISPDAINDEPIIFRYTGAAVDKEIRARYSGGMTMTGPSGFAENVALQFVADDPFFTQIGESAVVLDSNDTATFSYIAGRIDGVWSNMGPPNAAGTYTSVRVITSGTDGTVYIGGDFTNFDNQGGNFDFIVQWDGSSYTALGSGMNGVVHSMYVKADGTLLVGGAFTTAGGTTVRGIASWNGSAWSALGPPSSGGTVKAIAVGKDGKVYVGGSFDDWDGTAAADRIASWDGTNWAAVSSGADNDVESLVVDSDGTLYVSGDFDTIGGVAADNVASWNGTAFTSLAAAGSTDSTVNALHLIEGGELLAGGNFTQINSVSAVYIAAWNGAAWSVLGSGLQDQTLDIYRWRDFILIAGKFTGEGSGGGGTFDHVAIWNGSTFTHLDLDLPGVPNVFAVYADKDDLYIGYTTTGTGAYAGTTSVTPGGNTRIYPIIEIDRSGGTTATIRNIINETTTTYLWLDYALADGEKLTIDLRPGQQTATSSQHGVLAPIFQPSNLSSFYLLPNVANDIKTFVLTTGGPTVTATIKWQDSYWSID